MASRKPNYTHFTSPIRRYADLVVHRALAERDLARRTSRAMPQLSAIADHISATERNAAEAEIDAVKMKKLEFFESQLEARDPQVFRRSSNRRAQFRTFGRAAGDFADRVSPCLDISRRFLHFLACPAPVSRPAEAPQLRGRRQIARACRTGRPI